MFKVGLKPLIDGHTETLILGTLPGDLSLSCSEYYAHPKNLFWKMIYQIYKNELPDFDYAKKEKFLLENHIGLWDVLASAERHASLDSGINNMVYNNFEMFFINYPNIKTVIFNGSRASELYFNSPYSQIEKKYLVLPSTSSSNISKTFEIEIWKINLTFFV